MMNINIYINFIHKENESDVLTYGVFLVKIMKFSLEIDRWFAIILDTCQKNRNTCHHRWVNLSGKTQKRYNNA